MATHPVKPLPKPSPPVHTVTDNTKAVKAAKFCTRMAALHVPYFWGGVSERPGFDCSGLTMAAYKSVGIALPHGADTQDAMCAKVNNPGIGDLCFFDPGPAGSGGRTINGGAGHVGMYVGNGMMVDAPHTGAFVSKQPVMENGLQFMNYGRVPGSGAVDEGTTQAQLTSITGDVTKLAGGAIWDALGLPHLPPNWLVRGLELIAGMIIMVFGLIFTLQVFGADDQAGGIKNLIMKTGKTMLKGAEVAAVA